MNRSPVQTSSTARHETNGLLVWQLFVALANAAFRMLWSWQHRYRYRRELGDLDDHLLRDIGITRLDAQTESAKHFWQR